MKYMIGELSSFYALEPTEKDVITATGVSTFYKCVKLVRYGRLEEKPFHVISDRIHKIFVDPTECLAYLMQQYLIDFKRYKHRALHQQLILQVLI